ncbi:hypothetical protein FPOA_10647 [Fusarium poae]|uniref:Beta-xylosidase C-terminal Concanavalin A-like domain-containing protein n=1 Tax=Fusarium poae TaxID=36050 RepID=A0A1B8AEN0_FUSPO|nr:hypothetical protein FPOA_10647 [Fusarium poae]
MNFTLFSGVSGQPRLPHEPSTESFELRAVAGPDIWQTPACAGGRDDFNGPIYATPLVLDSFKKAKVTISANFQAPYSQGGLILFMPEADPTVDIDEQSSHLRASPTTWIKAGIELVDGQLFASVAAGKPYSDWSLTRLGESTATFELEQTNGSLWVYVTGSDGQRIPLRKLTWVFDMKPQWDVWVGVAACMPKGDGTPNGGSLAVQFRDFSVTTD